MDMDDRIGDNKFGPSKKRGRLKREEERKRGMTSEMVDRKEEGRAFGFSSFPQQRGMMLWRLFGRRM